MTQIFSTQQKPAGDFGPCEPAELLTGLVREALQSAEKVNRQHPVVIIDGPSGSGKSTLGKYLAKHLNAQLLQMDHIYASWDGLAAAGEEIVHAVLEPVAKGRDGRIQHWDWYQDAPGEWQVLQHDTPIVIEGSAALNKKSAPLATLRIWVEVTDENARKQRALEQRPGGNIYAPYWEHWGAQERQQIAEHQPHTLADFCLQPGVFPGDPLYTLVRGEL